MAFDYGSQRIPFIESPFLKKMINKSEEYSDLLLKLNSEGYCVFDPEIDPDLLVQANADIDASVQKTISRRILMHITITIALGLSRHGRIVMRSKKL